jgi:hypothetical protein
MAKTKPPAFFAGPYQTPRYRIGSRVQCLLRGEMTITSTSDGRIPWPMGRVKGLNLPTLVVYKDLAKALRVESAAAVLYWWGVARSTVTLWRRALDAEPLTPGTRKLHSSNGKRLWPTRAKKMMATNSEPERRAKNAAAHRGKPRPPHVIEALRKASIGRITSAETRLRLSESQKRHQAEHPRPNRWKPAEDRLVMKLKPNEAAKRTGRTVVSVYQRRNWLRVAKG